VKRWTDASRIEWIERRQKESLAWRLIHAFGSLRLAMLLLFTIAVACAVATVCESAFTAKIAQAYIYRAPWFVVWLCLLCVNLACAALSRWPWQKNHAGFVITHAGIIILLIGAAIGQHSGFEASVTLHKGKEPTNRLVLDQDVLQIDSPSDGATYIIPFDAQLKQPSEKRPITFAIPNSDLRFVVDGYSEKLALVSSIVADPQGSPGIELTFTSGMMSQAVPITLIHSPPDASVNDFFGRARIEWLHRLPEKIASTQTAPFEERQIVRGGYEPVIHSASGRASGFQFALQVVDGVAHLLFKSPSGKGDALDVQKNLRKPISFENVRITIDEYWPEFAMRDGQPISLSDTPNNPAVLIRVAGATPADAMPMLQLAPAGDSLVSYQLSRDGTITSRGVARAGEEFQLGWADWKARVEKVVLNARLQTAFQPGASQEPFPGVRGRLLTPDDKQGPAVWIASGRTEMLRAGEYFARVGFGLQTRTVPFGIGLETFQVPRDEGTDTPADFISDVYFKSLEDGRIHRATVHMNEPATYPPGLWPAVTGLGYKFSQASWNPDDLDETTLQVLHDPGWLLKWIGSLLVCAGIGTMFYWKPRHTAQTSQRETKESLELARL
jgi:hypothetical protein